MANEKRLIDQTKVYQNACAGCTRHGENLGECYHDEPCERLIFAFTVAEPVDAVEVKHGRWIWTITGEEDWAQYYVCSECGERSYTEDNYCPNCGADMRGSEE